MSKYERVRQHYEQGFWILDMVKNAVVKGWITKEEYKEITGKQYHAITN